MCSVRILLCFVLTVAFEQHEAKVRSQNFDADKNIELSCDKNEQNQTLCELTKDRKIDDTFLLCEGQHNWKRKELDLQGINDERWKDLAIEENTLDISHIKLNQIYIFSVCSTNHSRIEEISISSLIDNAPSNSNYTTDCKKWTNYTLQRVENETCRIKDSKNETTDLYMDPSKTLHHLQLSTKSKTFWKLQKPTIIKADKRNNSSCVVDINYTGILHLTMFVYLQDGCSLDVTATSNRTPSTTVDDQSQWKKIKLAFYSNEQTKLVIGRKCNTTCTMKPCWAIDEIKVLTDLNKKNFDYPILREAPVLEHVSDNLIKINIRSLKQDPVDVVPQKYILQYKKENEQNFTKYKIYKNREDVLNKTIPIKNVDTLNFQYKIRLLLSGPNNSLDKKIPELTVYKRPSNFDQVTSNGFNLSWHLTGNRKYACFYTCIREFCDDYVEAEEKDLICTSPLVVTDLKPLTKCVIVIRILENQRWQLYDEKSVTTHTATKIDEKNEMPDNIKYANNTMTISFKNCSEFNGPINYTFTIYCTSSWCKGKSSYTFEYNITKYSQIKQKNITLETFAYYNVTVTASRNMVTFPKTYQLRTPSDKPNPVRNLSVICRNNKTAWLQWLPPTLPSGIVSKYVITQKNRTLKEVPTPNHCDNGFICQKVQLSDDNDDNITSVTVRAESEDFKELRSSQSVEISSVPFAKEAIQNFTVVPSSEEICLKWEHLYLNNLTIRVDNKSKNVTNCYQHCDYRVRTNSNNSTLIVSSSNCENEEVTIEVIITSAPSNLSKNHMVEVCSEKNCNLYVPVPDNTSTGNFTLLIKNVNDGNTSWTVPYLLPQHNYIKVEIGPKKAVSLKNQSYVMWLQDVENKRSYPLVLVPEDSQYHITLAVLGLIIVIVITGIFMGYLVFAYFFKKYPFDVLKAGASRRTNLSKEEINQLSEHYKNTALKTIRKKAELPAKKSELEVLIEPSTSKQEKKSNVTTIEVKNFEDYLMTSLGDDPYSNDLTKQYRKLQKENVKKRTVGLENKNIHKNRYKNLIAFDDTRVILKDNGDSEYINANYVDGYENTKAFIATQAPLKSTLGDFWWMIWQEKVTSIIMLTELVEDGTVKCEQYWPDRDQKVRFGEILIATVTQKVFSDYVIREFQVSYGSESRVVHHLQYTTWPDHGVPLYPQNFTPFVKKLLAMPQKDAPIVVHCNAGCGRTGTLILCDIILRMAAKEKTVDFTKVLTKMREQRINLVHNVNQYVFAHVVVLECLFGVDFSIPINDSFQDEVFKVLRKTTIKPLMQQLNKVMEQFKKRQLCFTTNMSDDDKNKNRFSQILPGHAQIFLPASSENPSNYINAVIVDCYRCPKKFIVTQQPLANTVEDFWTLVKEYEVNTIVSLNEIDGTDPDCPKFWTHSSTKTTLQVTEEIDDRAFGTTKIKISDESDPTVEKMVNVIKMKNWQRETSYPRNPKDLILVFKETFNSSWKGNSQIVVTCYDGATACGLFVALAYLIEKINYEQSCDVFSAIRTVRQSREYFVQEWGQMEFLYKAAKVYIEEFENYDNFD